MTTIGRRRSSREVDETIRDRVILQPAACDHQGAGFGSDLLAGSRARDEHEAQRHPPLPHGQSLLGAD
jgi:hypothetical protein